MDRLTLKFASEQTSGFSGTEHLVIRTEYYRQGKLLSSHVPAFVYSLGATEGEGVSTKRYPPPSQILGLIVVFQIQYLRVVNNYILGLS